MSIPLDRLYNFLDSVSDHNLIIYGFYPHGSKKIHHLKLLNNLPKSWRSRKTQPVLIFHDQEPLDYQLNLNQIDNDFEDLVKDFKEFELLSKSADLQKLFKKMHIAAVCCVLNNLYDSFLLVHSEKNSHQVELFEKNNSIPIYYWNHAIIARDWFRYAEHDLLLKIKTQSPKTFLIYNRSWSGTREYRLKFAENLINTGLYQNCITSFSSFDDNVHYQDHNFKNKNFKLNRFDLEKFLSKNIYNSNASADYNNLDYRDSMIEVVLETLFDDTRNYLTEKTLRPIACKQPFILASTPGSLQYLRNYGFKTFNGFIDETYDTVADPQQRLDAITQEMQRISAMSLAQKNKLVQDIQPLVDYNQRLFFSTHFQDVIINEFKQNLEVGIAKLKSGSVGSNWKLFRKIIKDQNPELFYKCLHQDYDDIEWAHDWIDSNTKS